MKFPQKHLTDGRATASPENVRRLVGLCAGAVDNVKVARVRRELKIGTYNTAGLVLEVVTDQIAHDIERAA